MADEIAVYGVPGVDNTGKLVPFTPNPPWINIAAYTSPGAVDSYQNFTMTNSVAYPSPSAYYKDVFGNVHLRGTAEVVAPLGSWTNVILLSPGTAPTTNRHYPTTQFAPLAADAFAVLRIIPFGTIAVVQVRPFNQPLFSSITLEIEWETT